MSFSAFFDLSTGFGSTLYFRAGTYDRILNAVNSTERRLKIRREYYNGECRWNRWPLVGDVSDEDYCHAVEDHNRMVRGFYADCCEAATEPTDEQPEPITPEMAKNLFIGLKQLVVPTERWTPEYYQARMEAMYETLRGRPAEGMSFQAEPLTIEQARDVIVLFAQYLDSHDIRLDVCRGNDHLTNSSSEGYFWCSECGAVDYDDLPVDYYSDSNVCDECAADLSGA